MIDFSDDVKSGSSTTTSSSWFESSSNEVSRTAVLVFVTAFSEIIVVRQIVFRKWNWFDDGRWKFGHESIFNIWKKLKKTIFKSKIECLLRNQGNLNWKTEIYSIFHHFYSFAEDREKLLNQLERMHAQFYSHVQKIKFPLFLVGFPLHLERVHSAGGASNLRSSSLKIAIS